MEKEYVIIMDYYTIGQNIRKYRKAYNYSQEELADFLFKNGVDIILGNHPHVLQPIEVYKNKTIVYDW